MDDATRQLYGRPYINKIVERKSLGSSYSDSSPVVNAMIDAILSKHPKHRYLIGGLLSPGLWRSIIRYNMLPTWLSDMKMIKEQEALGVPAAFADKQKGY